jgi:hypothetical protein
MNLLILSSHGILEYDDLRLFTGLGYDVFMPGGYSRPDQPGETLRPAAPNAPYHPELVALCDEQRAKHEGQPTDFGIVDWAKADLHPDLVEWADVIMVNCFPYTWIAGQWDAIREKRVIWRTIGQSSPRLEHEMRPLTSEGLQIVRYSPAEKRAYERVGHFAGEDAMIRFAKDPADYGPWIGDDIVVGNVTQNLDIRGDHCGLEFWNAATNGLPVKLAGTGSERMGGIGELSWDGLRDYLRHIRAFLYMGTQPASYTLSLMEAMLAGVPVVSIGPEGMWMADLFEGHEIAENWALEPQTAKAELRNYLVSPEAAARDSAAMRRKGVELFGIDAIGRQWLRFLGNPVKVTAGHTTSAWPLTATITSGWAG